jgi:hypothetical protein
MRAFLPKRLWYFAIGTLLGGCIAFVFVSGHRKTRQQEQDYLRSDLPDLGLPESVEDALVGLRMHYALGQGPVRHRMLQEVALLPTDNPGQMTRVFLLKGQADYQRIRVEELLRLPNGLRTIGHLPIELLPRCQVLHWRATAVDLLLVEPFSGQALETWTERLQAEGFSFVRQQGDRHVLVRKPEGVPVHVATTQLQALLGDKANQVEPFVWYEAPPEDHQGFVPPPQAQPTKP